MVGDVCVGASAGTKITLPGSRLLVWRQLPVLKISGVVPWSSAISARVLPGCTKNGIQSFGGEHS